MKPIQRLIKKIILVFFTLTLTACALTQPRSEEPQDVSEVIANNEIQTQPEVTMGGKVLEIRGPGAFVLGSTKIPGKTILVLTERPIYMTYEGLRLKEGQNAFVTGSILEATLQDLEDRLQWQPDASLRAQAISEDAVFIAVLVENM